MGEVDAEAERMVAFNPEVMVDVVWWKWYMKRSRRVRMLDMWLHAA